MGNLRDIIFDTGKVLALMTLVGHARQIYAQDIPNPDYNPKPDSSYTAPEKKRNIIVPKSLIPEFEGFIFEDGPKVYLCDPDENGIPELWWFDMNNNRILEKQEISVDLTGDGIPDVTYGQYLDLLDEAEQESKAASPST